MQIEVGNLCTKRGESYEWLVFLTAPERCITSASMKLHPTFKQQLVHLKQREGGKKFESQRFLGWGTFRIPVSVELEDGTCVELEHELSFARSKTSSVVDVQLPESGEKAECGQHELSLQPLRPTLDPSDSQIFFGRGFHGELKLPQKAWVSNKKPRDDHDAPDWLTATEFVDQESVLSEKCAHLAKLLKRSRKTVIYSGAGISVAAGIGQAARGRAAGGKSTDALPTFTHYALGALSEHGLIHEWVQQNHDGLPQKAGFPQEQINEIHGSWYDPSNPVVKYSGSLKDDTFPRMIKSAETADLVLVLGTSLGGLNADRVATDTARRSLDGRALGSVIINLQQTEQDVNATLRVFGKTDDVFRRLLRELGITKVNQTPKTFGWTGGDLCSRVLVPYDKDGRRSSTVRTWLDLRPGAKVKLTPGHNIQGAQQPAYMHIGASSPDVYYGRVRQPGQGIGSVTSRDDRVCGLHLNIDGAHMLLGLWWLEAASRGGPAQLPVVNVHPVVEAGGEVDGV